MELAKWEVIGTALVILLLTGFFLFLMSFFWNTFLMLVGASLLIAGVIGLALFRWKWLMVKRANPEIIEALRAESRKRAEKEKEKTLGFKDLPHWLIAILLVILVISTLGYFGAFRFSPILDFSLTIVVILLGIYYFITKRRIKKQKYSQTQVAPREV